MKFKTTTIPYLTILLCLLVIMPLQAQKDNINKNPSQDKLNDSLQQLSDMMQIKIEDMSFKNANGEEMEAQAFMDLIFQGQSFNTWKDTVTKKAILSLNPPDSDVAKPKTLEKLNIKKGDKFPEFSLPSSTKSKISLNTLKGKPTFFSFYFVSCIPCIQEVPLLNKLQIQRGENTNFLAVAFNTLDEVEKFATKYHFEWNSLLNANDLIEKVGVKTYPTYILIDKNSKVIDIQSGYDHKDIENVLNSMFDQ